MDCTTSKSTVAKLAMPAMLLLFHGFAIAQCFAQAPVFHLALSATEVHAGTVVPVANPDGMIQPGEGVLLELATLGFEPPVGTVVQTSQGPGTIAGLAGFHAQLWGAGGAEGTWSNIERAPGWLGDPPSPLLGGTLLNPISLSQFPFAPLNSQNPIESAVRGVWTPNSYEPRAVDWVLQFVAPTGWGSLYAHYGNDPTTGQPLYTPVTVPHAVVSNVQVSIVPAPGMPVVLCTAGVVLLSHQRRRDHRKGLREGRRC